MQLNTRLDYWQRQLADVSASVQFLTDYPRSTGKGYKRAEVSLGIEASLGEQLETLSREQGCSLPVVLLAAFKALLYRYGSQDDMVVVVPVADGSTDESVLGVRTKPRRDLTFVDFVAEVNKVYLGSESQGGISGEQMRALLGTGHDSTRQPLFEMMFAFGNGVGSGADLVETCEVALFLNEGLVGSLSYRADLFRRDSMERMRARFLALLVAVVANPKQRLGDLPFLPASEERLLASWNETVTAFPDGLTVHEAFAAQVAAQPTAVAVVFGETTLTYEALEGRANQLAHYLRSLGVGPEVLVGLCVERSLEMVVATLAILKAGGAYVPLDPAYPAERLSFMLADTKASVLVGPQRLLRQLPEHEATVVALDAFVWDAKVYEEPPVVSVSSANLAYVMYTSGSTGRPKGVTTTHRNIMRLVKDTNYIDFSVEDVFLQLAPASFDAATLEIWGPLLNGGQLVVYPHTAVSLPRVAEVIKKEGISTLWLTAGLFHQMVEAELESLQGVSQLLAGGDVLSPGHVQQVLALPGERRLVNGYGPTECTTFSTCYLMHSVDEVGHSVSIGKPIANAQAFVLDPDLKPVPIGVAGILYVGGVGLSRGYLNRPALTAASFVPNPLAEDGSRLYCTGDVVRWLPDGKLEFFGRADFQVKIRGFRIELGEIESNLVEHPVVNDAVVIARDMDGGDKQLVAYVVLTQAEVAVETLRRFLEARLPAYMVPVHFIPLERFPLNLNGKVERKALPDPTHIWRAATDIRLPETTIQKLLVSIWSDLLGVEQIGLDDNFFNLGGHSLLATRLITQVKEVLGIELQIRDVFEADSVADLALRVEAYHQGDDGLVSIERAGIGNDYPLSYGQERIWFIQEVDPTNLAYHFQSLIRFWGVLNVEVLRQSLYDVVARHEIFRTSFPVVDGEAVQRVHDSFTVDMPLIDLTDTPLTEREERMQGVVRALFNKHFEVAQLPLVEWHLIQLDEADYVLTHLEHHLIHDGWSFNIFLRDLLEIYRGYIEERTPVLPQLPIQFGDFAYWQRGWLDGEVGQTQLAYWRQQLAGAPPLLELPTDQPRPPVQTFNGVARRIALPTALGSALLDFVRREGTTLYIGMLTAFAVLMTRYSGQTDFCLGAGMANRRWRETEPLVGMLVNNVVLRHDLHGNPSFRELMARTRQMILEAHAYQDVPFDKVVEAVQPSRDLSYNPLFQVAFSFHHTHMPKLWLPGVEIELTEGVTNYSAKFDMNIIVVPRPEQYVGVTDDADEEQIIFLWEYNTDLFEHETAARMIEHYQRLLGEMIKDPEQRIGEVALLSEDEETQLLQTWNETKADYPALGIHDLFAERVRQAPTAVALRFEGENITYSELDRRANCLASYLQSLGVGIESRVGLALPRSVDLVVTTLAILKTGGVYVPLDVTNPTERLQFMLSEAAVDVLVTLSDLGPQFAWYEGKVVHVDGFDWQGQAVALKVTVSPENLAYIMYTSGSTGRPKGVAITHRNVVRLVRGVRYADLTAENVLLQFAPISFDAATFEIWAALLNGASLVVAPSERLSIEALGEVVRDNGVTHLFLTAGLFHQFVEKSLDSLAGVQHVLTGGDVVSVPHVKKVLETLADTAVTNAYGPTEGTTFATCHYMTDVAQVGHTVSIGRPMANAELYILDSLGQPTLLGVPGELYIGGDGLARGYWQQPGRTAARFVPNPFVPGGRLYRTGDLVRYLPDGNVEFLGRIDHQVKIRGFRIELGEIEAAIHDYEDVKQVVVTVREYGLNDKRLVAYIVTESGELLPQQDLRQFLKSKLPSYMVPTAFVMLDALPLTANSKIDRRALPSPEMAMIADGELILPRTPIEEALTEIWCEILGLKQISMYDNFFELGGHSLLATRVVSRVREVLEVKISLVDLFDAPTVATLAERLIQTELAEADDALLLEMISDLDELAPDELAALLAGEEPMMVVGD